MVVDPPVEANPRVAMRGANIVAMGLDLIGAFILAVYGLFLGPLGILRGPLVIERALWYVWVLLPQGLMARAIRTALDWRMGHFDAAIAQLEGLVGSSEEYYKDRVTSRVRRRVLQDFYTVLCRAYLHAGHIDDAMLVIIRAKKSMGMDRLPGLAELDAKTAHLVRAGLAAGRLLDGGGLATMFVKSSQPAPQPAKPAAEPPRQGASKGPARPTPLVARPLKDVGAGAKIIPFPRRELP